MLGSQARRSLKKNVKVRDAGRRVPHIIRTGIKEILEVLSARTVITRAHAPLLSIGPPRPPRHAWSLPTSSAMTAATHPTLPGNVTLLGEHGRTSWPMVPGVWPHCDAAFPAPEIPQLTIPATQRADYVKPSKSASRLSNGVAVTTGRVPRRWNLLVSLLNGRH